MALDPRQQDRTAGEPEYDLVIERLRAGRRTLVSDYTCRLPTSGLVLVLGQNGVGKSLLLRALSNLDGRQSAAIQTLDGTRPETAVVFDFPGLMANDGIAGLLEKAQWFDCDEEQLIANLRRLGIDPDDERPFSQWSLGTRQRARIAVSLATRRPIVIMDEPFRSVDADQRFELISLLVAVAQTRLVLISTHHPELLAGFAPTALVLRQVGDAVALSRVGVSSSSRVHVVGTGIDPIDDSTSLRSGDVELQLAAVEAEQLRALYESLGSPGAATASLLVAPDFDNVEVSGEESFE